MSAFATGTGHGDGVSLGFAIENCVWTAEGVGPLVVVHTSVAAASLVAAAIDNAHFENVCGTLAGDDLVLVVIRDSAGSAPAVALASALTERYRRGPDREPPSKDSGWVTDVEAVGALVVIHTAPGAAALARARIEREKLPQANTVVAGDDTLVILTAGLEPTKTAKTLAYRFFELRDSPVGAGALGRITEVDALGSFVVIRTDYGAASLVAGAIDAGKYTGVRGTISDEDVLLVVTDVAETSNQAAEFARQLLAIKSGDTSAS